MRFTAAFALALLVIVAAGCDEKKPEPSTPAELCSARVDCPNDRTNGKLDECSDASFDPTCGPAYREYYACFQNNRVCDGKGLLDQDASNARCSEVGSAWTACVSPSADTFVEPDTAIEDTFTDPDTSTDDASPD